MTNKALIMVGNVGSGKTTWIKKFLAEHQDEKWAVISKDAIRFMLGGGMYIWDPEVFEPYIENWTKKAITKLLNKNINIIVDETNTSVDTRALLFLWIRNHVDIDPELIAVVMPKLTKNESILRKSTPETDYGFSITVWEGIWERKNSKYTVPEEYEGFDTIIKVAENWRTK